jgi:hypothetical protein
MKGTRRFAACVAALVAAAGMGTFASVRSSQIVERCGTAAGFSLGRSIRGAGLVATGRVADGLRQLRTPDGAVTVGVDGADTIREIAVRVPGAFTQRFIVVGRSTLGDVLQRYGQPTSSQRSGSGVVVDYAHDGVSFAVPGVSRTATVESATVHAKTAGRPGTNYDCRASAR